MARALQLDEPEYAMRCRHAYAAFCPAAADDAAPHAAIAAAELISDADRKRLSRCHDTRRRLREPIFAAAESPRLTPSHAAADCATPKTIALQAFYAAIVAMPRRAISLSLRAMFAAC